MTATALPRRLVACRCNACGAEFGAGAESFEEMTELMAGEPSRPCPACGRRDALPIHPADLAAERSRQPAGMLDMALVELAVGIESELGRLPADDAERIASDLDSLASRLRGELSRRGA